MIQNIFRIIVLIVNFKKVVFEFLNFSCLKILQDHRTPASRDPDIIEPAQPHSHQSKCFSSLISRLNKDSNDMSVVVKLIFIMQVTFQCLRIANFNSASKLTKLTFVGGKMLTWNSPKWSHPRPPLTVKLILKLANIEYIDSEYLQKNPMYWKSPPRKVLFKRDSAK